MSFITGIFALCKLILEILGLIKKAEDASREAQRQETRDSIDEGTKTNDQRPIEEAIGSPNSGAPGKYRDGVRERPPSNRG